jgi:hypothetical protein
MVYSYEKPSCIFFRLLALIQNEHSQGLWLNMIEFEFEATYLARDLIVRH